jgi:eukaryotic-like serine/threonine-protein kinase
LKIKSAQQNESRAPITAGENRRRLRHRRSLRRKRRRRKSHDESDCQTIDGRARRSARADIAPKSWSNRQHVHSWRRAQSDAPYSSPLLTMTPQQQMGREKEIFEGALEIASREERQGYIKGACGADAALLARVQALLKAHEETTGFLREQPAAVANKTIRLGEGAIIEGPGTIIGRYKILQQIGEGGCGVVYMAEQSEPVRRRVALKVIKLGMDTKSVIARFEAERQALAMMDHPNIAKVLDAGATETGRPYFVMELVRGVKMTDYCDEAKLSTRQRLDLFIQVCHAVQHAHQKGIIHRDLKPSNILVTINDSVPVPKVIDFGIAKATTGQQLTDKTLFTAYEQFIGTPAYMSPEQAVMTSLDIDTRSDIYALGVLLYELLTGRTPFDARELLQSGFDEMRRTIREVEPARPSTRLSTMGKSDLTSVAQRRHLDAPKLIHLLRGDLDWIVMKALEKDRTRRYETASGLAGDIQRCLSSEPVTARPPSSIYRFQKLVRRNKTAFAAVGAVMAALVLGLGLSLYLFVQEKQALQRALDAEKEQARLRAQAEAALAAEAQIREQAERGMKYAEAGLMLSHRRFDEAERIMNGVPPHAAAASIYSVLGMVHMVRQEWAAAATNYGIVTQVLPADHHAYHYVAPLLLQMGDTNGYRRHCERMLRQFAETSDPAIAERTVKDCLLLPAAKADLPTIAKLAEVAAAAGPDHRFWPSIQFAKGLAEFRQGRFSSAAEWLEPVLDKTNDVFRTVQAHMTLAMTQHHLQHSERARATLAKGIEFADLRLPKFEKGSSPEDRSNDWIIAHALMGEAMALIRPGATNSGANLK